MEIKGENIMNKNLNKLAVSGLMAAAVFGLGFSNTAVHASALDQPIVNMSVVYGSSNDGKQVKSNDEENASTSVAHVMSTGSNQSNASNGSDGENVSLSPAHEL